MLVVLLLLKELNLKSDILVNFFDFLYAIASMNFVIAIFYS